MTNIEHSRFKLPIEYLDDKKELNTNIINDLELIETKDPSLNCVLEKVFKPQDLFANTTVKYWTKYYTTNKEFLKDSANLIKSIDMNTNNDKNPYNNKKKEHFYEIYKIFEELDNDTGFYDRYNYIESSWFKNFNNNSQFLEILSIYNLASPIISLTIPIVLFILPFFLIKLNGIKLTFDSYVTLLKHTFAKHPIGSIFGNFKEAPLDRKLYVVFTIAFYLFQVYCNIMTCIKYYNNLSKIHSYLFAVKDYIEYTISQYETFINQTDKLGSFKPCIETIKTQKRNMELFQREIQNITPWKIGLTKASNIGHVLKCFYKLYYDDDIVSIFTYSFGFHGYIDNILNLNAIYKEEKINSCKFSRKIRKTKFKDAYFPAVIENPIKNSYKLKKHMLITGPNAAGKTTLLKTTLFNLIFSQQTGMGFYSRAIICPFDNFHCYLNIPDTSGRDSLYQAEARRCKDIIESVERFDKETHFCIFDELYSGTNPYEAISSAISFLNYINKKTNISYLLTTHYLELCTQLTENKKYSNSNGNINYHMKVIEKNNDFTYTYKLNQGLSNVKGGVKVLSDLEYPKEIILSARDLINNINV